MTTRSLAQPARPTTPETARELRGLALYREHAGEIRYEPAERAWLVPSQHDATSVYEVTIGRRGDSCECRDFEFRGGPCLHIFAATVAKAKSAACAGCGERFPRRELLEVGPERAEMSLEAREGERYCPGCARRHALL